MRRLVDFSSLNYQAQDDLFGPFSPLPQVSLLSFIVESEHTFLDYIKGG